MQLIYDFASNTILPEKAEMEIGVGIVERKDCWYLLDFTSYWRQICGPAAYKHTDNYVVWASVMNALCNDDTINGKLITYLGVESCKEIFVLDDIC